MSMDADDGSVTKIALRKRPRRTVRDKSEFVSMEVGMREFKKRLAAPDYHDGASSVAMTNAVEDLTQHVNKTKSRSYSTTNAIKPTSRRKTVSQTVAKNTTTLKKKVAAKKKTATAVKVSTGKLLPVRKKSSGKKTKCTAAKSNLAEIKTRLAQEQKDRVESRILTLRRDAKPVAMSCASIGAVASSATSVVDPACLDHTALSVHIDSATAVQPQRIADDRMMKSLFTTKPPGHSATGSNIVGEEAKSSNVVSTPNLSSAVPPSNLVQDKFNGTEEDYLFAMALEEVEQKLGKPQTLPFSNKTLPATTPVAAASVTFRASVTSTFSVDLANAEPLSKQQPSQVVNAAQQQETDAVTAGVHGVLEEIERLKRENDYLRRSNDLLQAAVTTPVHAKQLKDEQNAVVDQSKTSGQKSESLQLLKANTLDTSVLTSTARYLYLANCNRDQDIKHAMATLKDDRSLRCAAEWPSTESQSNNYLDGHGIEKNVRVDTIGNGSSCDNIDHAGTENTLTFDQKASISSKPSSTLLFDHVPICKIEQKLSNEEVGESIQSARFCESKIKVDLSFNSAKTESDGSGINIREACEANEQDDQEEVGKDDLSLRVSTIDRGNCAEYKIKPENMINDGENDLDNKAAVFDKDVTPAQSSSSRHVFERHSREASNENPKSKIQNLQQRFVSGITDTGTANAGNVRMKAEGGDFFERKETSSSSSSALDSDVKEDESDDSLSSNVLEAALKAVGSDSGRKVCPESPNTDTSDLKRVTSVRTKASKTILSNASLVSSLAIPMYQRKRASTGPLSTTAKNAQSSKSSVLWPALDEFYDFLLELSPKNAFRLKTKSVQLQQYASGKLPAQYSTIKNYCDVQFEAILEELTASVSNNMGTRGETISSPIRHLFLASVTPCRRQRKPTSLGGLGLSTIYSESGYSGNGTDDDYILTFHEPALSNFVSGDLVLLRSPRWKKYEMRVFGVVLCNSMVAVGGSRGKGGTSHESDQICVLVRVQETERDGGVENLNKLTEVCLSNQGTPNWRWSIQQVHNTITSAREFQAIKSVLSFPHDLQQEIIRGKLSTVANAEKCNEPTSLMLSPRLLKYLNKHYNDSQVQAILGCMGEDRRVIIQGPPGTGKTKTILGLLSALLDGGGLSSNSKSKGTARIRVGASLQDTQTSKVAMTAAKAAIRVLVAAPSNAAVDELVVRVLGEGLYDGAKDNLYRPRIVRVGRPENHRQVSGFDAARKDGKSKTNRKKMRKFAREVEEVLLETLVSKHRDTFPSVKEARQGIIKNAQIVFCTLSGAGSVAMCEFAQHFDALIIDEAAQAVEASTLIPFKFRPQRVVLVGDHRQLSATVIARKLVTMGYDRSLLQRLVENGSPVLLLTQQYRMHPEIAKFPSTYFYNGRLVQDDTMREWTAQEYHAHDAFTPLLFFDVQGAQSQVTGSTSLRNLSEVEAVTLLLRCLLVAFPRTEWKNRIGVITPYKQQIYEVRGAIEKLEAEFHRQLSIEVNTVDGFQGREKEIIVYSCVRTSHGGRRKKARHSNGDKVEDVLDTFWADERRMNVAITRAKSSLWIVGNATLLMQSVAWRAFIQHTKDHDRFIHNDAFTCSAASTTTFKTNKTKDVETK